MISNIKPKYENSYVNSNVHSRTLIISNSFCHLANFPGEIMQEIETLLTYEDREVFFEMISVRRMLKRATEQGVYRKIYALRKRLAELETQHIVCLVKESQFPTGLLELVIEKLKRLNCLFSLEDRRKKPSYSYILRWNNRPPKLRYYQKEMVEIAEECSRGVFESAVGSGKTLVMANIIKEKGVNTLVIVPSRALLEQTYRVLSSYFGKSKVQIVKTPNIKAKKRIKAAILLTTVQTLVSLAKSNNLNHLVQDIDMLMVDEGHHTGAKSYTNLLPSFDHVYYRYGFTGTFIRNDSKTLEMYGFLSSRLYQYLPRQATQEGFLTPVKFKIQAIPGRYHANYQREYDLNYCNNPDLLNAILGQINNIPRDDQILILVDRKDKAGALIHEFLSLNKLDNVYISGDNKKEDIANAIEDFNEKKNRILVGSSVIGEGVDICSTQHLILATGGKSLVKIVQAIGRCVRLYPGKDQSCVYDFCFQNTNFMEKHCAKRLDIYHKQFAGEIGWLK